jgi:lipopolysaccharide/colanic/teichoic acid biosynthesis glycosyltransferase
MDIDRAGLTGSILAPGAGPDGFRPYDALKRALDIVGSVGGLVVLSPLLAACAVAVRVDSRGSVLFRQERVGQGGRRFVMLKFRSMHPDVDPRLTSNT